MGITRENDEIELTEVAPSEELFEERWFAERPSTPSMIPGSRRSSAPPIGDSDVDPWLR